MGIVAVATAQELTTAITSAQPGDEIVLADGTYRMTGVTCGAVGTEAAPIKVHAANRRAAKIELDGLEGFKVTGAYWQFEGLDVTGVCATDSACEHAFHVMGAAHHFTLRDSRVADFNAQLKVNAATINGTHVAPDAGLVEYNDIGDTRGRATTNPVTKLNIDTGDDWIVRGNYLHDAQKLQDNQTSYLAFLKSGGKRGLVERNLVVCAKDVATGGVRIGLSLGGGGTGAQYCAPAYDPNVPCTVEHDGGTIRNNIIANCTDVGIYLNRAKNSKLLYNTLIATAGIDFRYATSTGEAVGNVMAGKVRNRDGSTGTFANNLTDVAMGTFTALYQAPLIGDLTVIGDATSLIGMGPARTEVPDDYCGRARPSGMYTLGAVEHSLGTCTTTTPPDTGSGGGDAGAGGGDDDAMSDGGGGCCDAGARGSGATLLAGAVALALVRRRSRPRTSGSSR